MGISITAYAPAEPHATRVRFGDDTAAAGNLVGHAPDGDTVVLGDAVADPLTGITAAVPRSACSMQAAGTFPMRL